MGTVPKEKSKFDLFGEICFTLSVSNIILSTYILAKTPWHYWLFHSLKNSIYITSTYIRNIKRNWTWFLADFCYVVNYMTFFYFALCVAKANLPALAFLKPHLDPLGPTLFRMAYTWSTGVLATSVGAFTNSMVFHSPAHMSILAVHIGPPLVVYTFRWYNNELQGAYPDTFHISPEAPATFHDLVWLPLLGYFILWTVPYSLTVFVFLKEHIEGGAMVTMFSYYEKVLFGNKGIFPAIRSKEHRQALYMLTHGTICSLTFLIAFVCWHSFWLNTAWLLALIHLSIWNGATYYFKVCMNPDRLGGLRNATKVFHEIRSRTESEEQARNILEWKESRLGKSPVSSPTSSPTKVVEDSKIR